METNHVPTAARSTSAHETVAHANAWLDGWREGVELGEHLVHPIDVGGHSAAWVSGFRAARKSVNADDSTPAVPAHSDWHNAARDVDDPCDVSVCDSAPTPNPRALLHVIATHPTPDTHTPVSRSVDVELAHAHERALLATHLGMLAF